MLQLKQLKVSVPIRGLFNLTLDTSKLSNEEQKMLFPSPLGDYLI